VWGIIFYIFMKGWRIALKKYIILFFLLILVLFNCKKEDNFIEPANILNKWGRAIQELNYHKYAECEAYPKNDEVFKEMYKDYYITDLMVTSADNFDKKNIKQDYEGNEYIHRSVAFEGNVVKRSNGKPYQVLRGDAIFIKFQSGKRAKDGWLISNRTLVTINK
jgi:hypothetical protein